MFCDFLAADAAFGLRRSPEPRGRDFGSAGGAFAIDAGFDAPECGIDGHHFGGFAFVQAAP